MEKTQAEPPKSQAPTARCAPGLLTSAWLNGTAAAPALAVCMPRRRVGRGAGGRGAGRGGMTARQAKPRQGPALGAATLRVTWVTSWRQAPPETPGCCVATLPALTSIPLLARRLIAASRDARPDIAAFMAQEFDVKSSWTVRTVMLFEDQEFGEAEGPRGGG